MANLPYTFLVVVNFFLFYAFIGLGVVIIVVGRYYSFRKKLSPSWILLSIGVMLAAFRSLIDVTGVLKSGPFEQIGNPIFGLASGFLIVVGTIVLILEGSIESTNLMRREEELKLLIQNLKEKYMKRQLNEVELSKLTSDVVKELAEIEVKLKTASRKDQLPRQAIGSVQQAASK